MIWPVTTIKNDDFHSTLGENLINMKISVLDNHCWVAYSCPMFSSRKDDSKVVKGGMPKSKTRSLHSFPKSLENGNKQFE